MYWDLRPKLWTPQRHWLDIFVYRNFCPKSWTSLPNWCDIFMYGDSRPKLWTPLLDWRDVLVHSSGYPSLNGTMYLHLGIAPRLWTFQPIVVVCLFLCSVTRICIHERFWSRVVDNLCKHPSNTYIVIRSDLLQRWTLHKFPHGQFTGVVNVRSLHPSTNSY